MRRVLIVVADEAIRFLDRSAGHRLARMLREPDAWTVELLAGATGPGSNEIVAAVRRFIARENRLNCKPAVILFGDTPSQRRLVWELVKAGLRPQISLVLHLRVAAVPMAGSAAEILALADLVVVDSRFEARAVRTCLQEAHAIRKPRIAVIPRGLDEAASRRRRRSDAIPCEAPFQVGCVLEPYSERSAFLALWIFALFADALYSVCEDCHFVTPWSERAEDFEPVLATVCTRCGSSRVRRGDRWHASLRLVAFPTPRLEDEPTSTWDLATFRSALRLDGRVFVEGEDGFATLDTESAWLDCLSSFDAHLSPHLSADVDCAALATCALGVPTLTTRFGASSEILVGQARLVQPRDLLLDSAGHWTPVMDPGAAAVALAEMAAKRAGTTPRAEARDPIPDGHGRRQPVQEWRRQLVQLDGKRP